MNTIENITLEKLAKERQNAYMKKWRSENKDKVKRHNENYWKNRVLKELQKEGEYHEQ